MITFDEFKKADIRIGTILSAEKVPDTDKLIKLMISLGEDAPRQILSGIAMHYTNLSVLVGKQVPVLANLPTRIIRGLESQGMVLYAVGINSVLQDSPTIEDSLGESFLTTVNPDRKVPDGTRIQ